MNFLHWFTKARGSSPQPFTDGDFFRIPSHDFFGWFSTSANGRYTISWMDGNDDGTCGGARSSGLGRYFLLDGTEIVVAGHLERPNDGKVADNGTFVLNDWKFSSDLVGDFCAFRSDGSAICINQFDANLLNNGLSTDGGLAVCQTCNSPTGDGGMLVVFDLFAAKEVGRWVPECGWAQDYQISDDRESLRLIYSDGASFAYSLDGEFLDREKWIGLSLKNGDLAVIDRLMRDAENRPDPELANKLIGGVRVALKRKRRAGDEYARAWALKLNGFCLEALGEQSNALQAYDEAVDLHPKIGVKRRATALKKSLNQQ